MRVVRVLLLVIGVEVTCGHAYDEQQRERDRRARERYGAEYGAQETEDRAFAGFGPFDPRGRAYYPRFEARGRLFVRPLHQGFLEPSLQVERVSHLGRGEGALPELAGQGEAEDVGAAPRDVLLVERGALVQNYEALLGFSGIAVAFLARNNPIGIIFAAILWGILSRGEVALQIESEVPREFILILQGILILTVVITYQIAKRRLAARQLQRAGAAGELEDSAGSDEDAGPQGPEISGREAFEGAGEGGV